MVISWDHFVKNLVSLPQIIVKQLQFCGQKGFDARLNPWNIMKRILLKTYLFVGDELTSDWDRWWTGQSNFIKNTMVSVGGIISNCFHGIITHLYLVGGFNLPLWNMMEFVSWDDEIPNIWKNKVNYRYFKPYLKLIYGKIKNIPKHQPGRVNLITGVN